ncbi:MAG TPA: rod shape-determining protein MreD [Acidimicrobiales bacterium]|nr:rod shape-determining protein MreD [Acidimicrobiales bacterium]
MRFARPAFVVFVLVTLQTTLLADIDVFGARGDIVMLLPIAAGIAGGRERGAIVGFIAGFALDLVVHGTPTGFFALGYTLVGYFVGMVQAGVLRAAWWIPVLTALGGSALGVLTLAIVGKFIGLEVPFDRKLVTIALVVAVLNAMLVLPMMRVTRWALPVTSRGGRLVTS